ncbi:hypothetical protein WDU94_012365, partial [Cyamophila willieti]
MKNLQKLVRLLGSFESSWNDSKAEDFRVTVKYKFYYPMECSNNNIVRNSLNRAETESETPKCIVRNLLNRAETESETPKCIVRNLLNRAETESDMSNHEVRNPLNRDEIESSMLYDDNSNVPGSEGSSVFSFKDTGELVTGPPPFKVTKVMRNLFNKPVAAVTPMKSTNIFAREKEQIRINEIHDIGRENEESYVPEEEDGNNITEEEADVDHSSDEDYVPEEENSESKVERNESNSESEFETNESNSENEVETNERSSENEVERNENPESEVKKYKSKSVSEAGTEIAIETNERSSENEVERNENPKSEVKKYKSKSVSEAGTEIAIETNERSSENEVERNENPESEVKKYKSKSVSEAGTEIAIETNERSSENEVERNENPESEVKKYKSKSVSESGTEIAVETNERSSENEVERNKENSESDSNSESESDSGSEGESDSGSEDESDSGSEDESDSGSESESGAEGAIDTNERSSENEVEKNERNLESGVKKSVRNSISKAGANSVKKKKLSKKKFKQTKSLVRFQTCSNKKYRDKKHCCLFCHGLYHKISRHLQIVHKNEDEVIKIINLPKGSKKKEDGLLVLVREGDFYHNAKVLELKTGELILTRRLSKSEAQSVKYTDFGPCPFCLGFILKKNRWKHTKQCPGLTEEQRDMKYKHFGDFREDIQNQSETLLGLGNPASVNVDTEFYENVIAPMRNDEITNILKNDELILRLGAMMYEQFNVSQKEYIRQSMRLLGRFFSCLNDKKDSEDKFKSLSDVLKPCHFDTVVDAVRKLAIEQKEPEERTRFEKNSLVLKLGPLLKKVATLFRGINLKKCGLKNEDRDLYQYNQQQAKYFLVLMDLEWKFRLSSSALSNMKEKKFNDANLLPLTSDLINLRLYIDKKQEKYMKNLSNGSDSVSDWRGLSESTLASILLFNKRRSGELSKTKANIFENINYGWNKHSQEQIDQLSPLEKELSSKMTVIKIKDIPMNTIETSGNPNEDNNAEECSEESDGSSSEKSDEEDDCLLNNTSLRKNIPMASSKPIPRKKKFLPRKSEASGEDSPRSLSVQN